MAKTGPDLTARGSTNRPRYTTVTHMQRSKVCPMQIVGLPSMNSHKLRSAVWSDFVGIPWEALRVSRVVGCRSGEGMEEEEGGETVVGL